MRRFRRLKTAFACSLVLLHSFEGLRIHNSTNLEGAYFSDCFNVDLVSSPPNQLFDLVARTHVVKIKEECEGFLGEVLMLYP